MRRLRAVPPSELAESAACVVTSPPYNVGLGYDGDHEGDVLAWDAYWRLADAAADMMARALVPGGRVWVNTAVSVPEIPGPPAPLRAGREAAGAAGRGWADAWSLVGPGAGRPGVVALGARRGLRVGVLAVPAAPNLRGDHELITLAPAGTLGTPGAGRTGGVAGHGGRLGGPVLHRVAHPNGGRAHPTWQQHPGPGLGHPAPMPVEVARRCIRLSTWPGETVLDPFAGSGTTLLAARQLGRRAIGIERSERYCELAVARLAQGSFDFQGAA